jgi:hypothetical protein
MHERQRLLALLEVYDTAIEELYVLGDRGFVDLILRLERRRRDASAGLATLGDHARDWQGSIRDTPGIDSPFPDGRESISTLTSPTEPAAFRRAPTISAVAAPPHAT